MNKLYMVGDITKVFQVKKFLWLCMIGIASTGLAQTLPFSIAIPPAPGSNTVEAVNSIRITPNYQTTGGQSYTFRIVPNRYATAPSNSQNDYNYVRSEQILVEVFNSTAVNDATANQKAVSYQYFDGLGRASQTVQVKGAPDYRDLVVPIQYDQYGRQAKQYLPYATAIDGRYQATAVTDQAAFFNPSSTYNAKVKTDAAPFAETIFEKSPLNRVVEQGATGTAWQPDQVTPSNGKTLKASYGTNIDGSGTGQEKIKIWTLTAVSLSGAQEYLVSNSAYYASGALTVSVTKDEDNREVRTYTDKTGRMILKKMQDADSPALNNDNDWTLIYYIYDEAGMLRFVLQPKFIARNGTYDALSTDQLKKNMLDSLTFEYRYDERGRIVYKRLPGAKHVELVYDKWDRPVLSQDGNQRLAGRWAYIKYDVYNRPIMTGEVASGNTRSQMVATVNAMSTRYETTASGTNVGYTTDQTYPIVSLNDIYTINYYDDYGFKDNLSLGMSYDASMPAGFNGVATSNVKGLATGCKVRVLDSSPTIWLLSAIYYDRYYRVIQTVADDQLGNKNKTTMEYFGITSLITKTQFNHGSVFENLTEFEYDHRGRNTKVWQKMDGASWTLVASNTYNALGQLVEKNVHSTDNGSTFLQSNDYRYNIRGWLSSINNSALSNDGSTNDDTNDLFGMELKYGETVSLNGTNTTAQFNGNISAVQWKTKNLVDDPVEKIYGFNYDNLHRLTDASYATKNGSTWTGNANLYDENLTYDKNGNIRTLKRRSLVNSTTNALVDDMTYYYKGNQLDAISDNAASSYKAFGFAENMSGITSGEYMYDANGSMEVDQNKGVVGPTVPDAKGILYNYLNLPKEVRLGQKKIVYTYSALGTRLRKTVYDQSGSEISRTNYVGGIQYEGSTPQLKFIATSEGRMVKDGTSWNNEYFHKDHLGNTRVVYGYQKQMDEYKATLETPSSIATREENQFKNIAATRSVGFNYTPASQNITSPAYSAETNGNVSGREVGPAKMLQVSSGDRIQMEVFARYLTATGSNNNVITTLASAVTGAFSVVNAGETAAAYQALSNNVPITAGSINKNSGVAKAYLFYILFDNNYAYKQFGYQAITNAASVTHERLYLDITVPNDGLMYIYVANESNVSTSTSVFFDDLSIVHKRTSTALQVLQTMDYYPLGLTFNSYEKDHNVGNNKLFVGKEMHDDLGLDVLDFGARMYDPARGRWDVVDNMAELAMGDSPYIYAGNDPINMVDVGGNFKINAAFARRYPTLAVMVQHYLPMLKQNQHVKSIFMKFTGFTSKQFDEMVTYGGGPWITITKPYEYNFEHNNDFNYVEYNTYDEKNIYLVDHDFYRVPGDLTDLENMMKSALAGHGNNDDLGAQMFLVSIKIMHEAAHRAVYFQQGKKRNNAREDAKDQGSEWEKRTYRQFTHQTLESPKINKEDVYRFYYQYYNANTMLGMTPTNSRQKKKKDADEEAKKRSG